MTNFYATIARYYDAEHHDKTEDLAFYSEAADTTGGPILIIGSGTGRVMLHLAQEGHTVHGIEIESAMLERARRKREAMSHLADQLVLHQGDALKVELPTAFRLAIIPYNSLMHFHAPAKHLGLLRRARQWIEPGGRLIIDLPNAGEAFAAPDTEALTLERTFLEPESGHLVMQQSVSRLDRATQLMQVTWIYDEIGADSSVKRTFAPVTIRYFFEAEIRLLLKAVGFEVEAIYGDFDESPFEDGCPRMIVVAK